MQQDASDIPPPLSSSLHGGDDQLQTGKDRQSEISHHILAQQEDAGQLKAEGILLEEFRNASSITTQAQQDRSSLFNLYLLIAVLIISGLGLVLQTLQAPKILSAEIIGILVGVVFLLAALLSFAFFRRLLGLLQEQYEGIIGMEVIKKFYVERFKHQIPLEQVLLWKSPIISSLHVPGSPTFFMGSIMAIIGSLYMSAAVTQLIFVLVPLNNSIYTKTYGYIIAVPLYFVLLLLHFLYYNTVQKKIYKKMNQLVPEFSFTKTANESE